MTDRFPTVVVEALVAAGWHPGYRDDERGRDWAVRIAAYVGADGRHHLVGPAAIRAYAEFGGLRLRPAGEGEQIAPGDVDFDPFRAVHSVATLAGLADAVGVPLSPLGVEGADTGILAIDATGRVFVLDHGGDWFFGDDLDQAITALVLGVQPARVASDGTW
ncbi:SUKH-3 domain-containing protein [Solwaraspora sp. WMMD406]|uniref:SUKH-3 domain-containing protein n=1 Tax=Solwaraspora sp. WMMD406 TaxID=3016095 RepID=UPI0024166A40|nr:SUKH-3 domain-containing protein [Solwaraspora sp. WMMD406]MDG4762759.1 SUKH-3 domain-containing protein [Solwaraspora sp. WMMD406]